MKTLETYPQTITYLIISLSCIPRFFSDSAFQLGTVLILIFWIAPSVILPELITGYSNKKIKFLKLPNITLYTLIITTIIIVISFFIRNKLYASEINNLRYIKISLYLLHPLIYFSWYPIVDKKLLKTYFKIGIILTLGLALSLTVPKLIHASIIGNNLNHLSAVCSTYLLSIFSEMKLQVNSEYFYNDQFSIKIGANCSSVPQIVISLFSILAIYICCKINSFKIKTFIVLIAVMIAFITNVFRIALMGYFVSIEKMNLFHFWHDGAGSLLFSFVVMFLISLIYYLMWCKENPATDEI